MFIFLGKGNGCQNVHRTLPVPHLRALSFPMGMDQVTGAPHTAEKAKGGRDEAVP